MKKIKIKKLRKWFETNKVFFEVFSFLFLGVASFVVALFSYKASKSQLEILKLEHSPLINIQREFEGEHEILKVNNVGYHLFEPFIDYSTYFIVKDYRDEYVKSETDFYFKVVGYFGLSHETDNTTGNISSIIPSPYSFKESKRLTNTCKSLFGSNFSSTSFEHLIRVIYKDENKDRIIKYFLVDSFSIIEVSEKTYNDTQQKYNSHNLSDHKYLNKVSSEEILSDIRTIYKQVIVSDEISDNDI